MGIFDVIGPVMVGPGSSHTAGAVIETMGHIVRRLPDPFRETARGGPAALLLPP